MDAAIVYTCFMCGERLLTGIDHICSGADPKCTRTYPDTNEGILAYHKDNNGSQQQIEYYEREIEMRQAILK